MNDVKTEEREATFSGDSVPSINNSQELQNLLFNASAMNQLQQLARVMSLSRVTVPAHFQNNEGDCMAVCMQAAQWGMNPFSVAQKTHLSQGGQLGYEAQLVNAVVVNRAPIKGRPKFEFFGDWDKIIGRVKEMQSQHGKGKYYVADWKPGDEVGLGVYVSATLIGEDEPRTLKLLLSQCYPRFSTQWATDPQQQITYAGMKKWARRHCPDVILGVYTTDEIEEFTGNEREVGPIASAAQPQQQPASRPIGFISEEQAQELLRLAKVAGVDEQYVCTAAHVGSIYDIKAIRYEAACNHLKRLAEANNMAAEEVSDAAHS